MAAGGGLSLAATGKPGLPFVPIPVSVESDSWAVHTDKELSPAELAELQGMSARMKPVDAPEHPDYKVLPLPLDMLNARAHHIGLKLMHA